MDRGFGRIDFPGCQAEPPCERMRFLEVIGPQMDSVERTVRAQLATFDPGVRAFLEYVLCSHGKRLRPALALLSGGAAGRLTDEHVTLGVVLEMVHLATLVHDDVIDKADVRRGRVTPNAKWGDLTAVLVGDTIFSKALELATSLTDGEVCRQIARAAGEVCQGEILQNRSRYDFQMSVDRYLEIVGMKTAPLFRCASELGARLAGADAGQTAALRNAGTHLGTAYQIFDDCLDLIGLECKAGKSLGSDCDSGKLTLPLLDLLDHSTPTERDQIGFLILSDIPGNRERLVQMAVSKGCMKRSLAVFEGLLEQALMELRYLEDSVYRMALFEFDGFFRWQFKKILKL